MENSNTNTNTTVESQGQVDTNNNETEKTYTQAEVDALLQRETDRRVTSALKKQAEKQRESDKLAKMSETEKYEYQLQQREQAIAEKEKQLALSENKNVASRILADKGLSLELVDFVIAEDAETMDANIKLLDKAFKASVKMEVEKRLGSKIPTKNLAQDGSITKEQFAKMSIIERQRLSNEQPEIYKSLVRH